MLSLKLSKGFLETHLQKEVLKQTMRNGWGSWAEKYVFAPHRIIQLHNQTPEVLHTLAEEPMEMNLKLEVKLKFYKRINHLGFQKNLWGLKKKRNKINSRVKSRIKTVTKETATAYKHEP
jgi:hypothetical protein